jgi:hypothetical protein
VAVALAMQVVLAVLVVLELRHHFRSVRHLL